MRRPRAVDGVREALAAAGYTVDAVSGRLGPVALAALHRLETVPARRATSGGEPLDTLIRLFLLQDTVAEGQAARALPLDAARALGLVTASGSEVRAALDVRPYTEHTGGGQPQWWVVSDLGTGLDGTHRPLPREHVLGIGGASTTLAQATIRDPVARALDLGTGCGVQALHASRHSTHVVATDLSARALRLAELTAGLSGVAVDLRPGDLFEPVGGEQFDLVVSNPPFVIAAPAARRHTYRDSPAALDGLTARLLAGSVAHLAPGGTFQSLASWAHPAGQPWDERVSGWLPDGVDALAVQREVLDPAEYVATWLRDEGIVSGPAYTEAYDAWLTALETAGVDAVGFGILTLRRTDAATRATLLDWPHPVQQPLGPHLAGWLQRQRFLATADLAGSRLRPADDVVQEQVGPPGAEDPQHVVLRQQVGLRRAFALDTATAGLAGACDGTLTVAALLQAVVELLGPETTVDWDRVLERVGELVEAGVLHPVG